MIARSLEDLPHDSAQPRPRTCQSAVRVASSVSFRHCVFWTTCVKLKDGRRSHSVQRHSTSRVRYPPPIYTKHPIGQVWKCRRSRTSQQQNFKTNQSPTLPGPGFDVPPQEVRNRSTHLRPWLGAHQPDDEHAECIGLLARLATTTACTMPAIISPSQPIRQRALISDDPVAPAAAHVRDEPGRRPRGGTISERPTPGPIQRQWACCCAPLRGRRRLCQPESTSRTRCSGHEDPRRTSMPPMRELGRR